MLFFLLPGFFLLLSTILGIVTMFVSKPVEDKFEIHDKEIEVLSINDYDSGDAKHKLALELNETKGPTDLKLNIEKGVVLAENDLDDVQHSSGSKNDQLDNLNNINETNKLLDSENRIIASQYVT